jgi:hypothetical protein
MQLPPGLNRGALPQRNISPPLALAKFFEIGYLWCFIQICVINEKTYSRKSKKAGWRFV